MDVSKPSETPLLQNDVEARHLGSAKDLLICFMVLSFDVKDASEAAHVKGIKSSFLTGLQCSGLAPI